MPEKLIAIKGFRIPETCLQCPMLVGGWCGVAPPEIDERVAETVDEAFKQKRPDWCPLVEVEPVHQAIMHRNSLCHYCTDCQTMVFDPNSDQFCRRCGAKLEKDDYYDPGSGIGQTFSP